MPTSNGYIHHRYEKVRTRDQCSPHDYECILAASDQADRERWVAIQEMNLVGEQLRQCVKREGQATSIENCRELALQYMKRTTRFFGHNRDVSNENSKEGS